MEFSRQEYWSGFPFPSPQLHSAQDTARILMCHCLAAIAMQLPVLGDGMLGDLVELYKVIGRSATDTAPPTHASNA